MMGHIFSAGNMLLPVKTEFTYAVPKAILAAGTNGEFAYNKK